MDSTSCEIDPSIRYTSIPRSAIGELTIRGEPPAAAAHPLGNAANKNSTRLLKILSHRFAIRSAHRADRHPPSPPRPPSRSLSRGDALLRSTSPKNGGKDEEDLFDTRDAAQAPSAVHDTPRHRRVESLGGDDITLSPGELGGSQYIMSPGHQLKNLLWRTESTMSDGHSGLPSSVEEVAAEVPKSQRLFPIFAKGRKTVHLVRHGQSTYNEAISGPGTWNEPNIFDAPLTKLGRNQATALGSFLAKLPKDAVWVTSPLTRAMETCVYGYKASLQVKAAQKRKGAAMREAANGMASHQKTGSGLPPSGRRRSRLSSGGLPSGAGTSRASDENGYLDGDPMVGTTPAPNRIDEIDEPGSRDAGAVSGGRFPSALANGYGEERTPAPTREPLRTVGSDLGELAPDANGASPCDSDFDQAEMMAWGDKVFVSHHLSEKLSTSGDIGRCKGVLINEFPLLAGGLSRLPGDVWWYNQQHRPNDAERQQFSSHEPSQKFIDRVERFRSWLTSRDEKVFVVFGHSTFFKHLTGGHRSLKNCEVHTYHL